MNDPVSDRKRVTRLSTAHIPPFGLRLQEDLRKRLERSSAEAGRSMNAEIVRRLERSYDDGQIAGIDPLAHQRVLAFALEHQVSIETALSMLILSGTSEGRSVIYVKLEQGATAAVCADALMAADELAPGSPVFVEQGAGRSPTRTSQVKTPLVGAAIENFTGPGVIHIHQGGR